MTHDTALRTATHEDAAILDALIRDLAAHEKASDLIAFSVDQVAAALAASPPRLNAILAEDSTGPLGFITYTVDFAIWNGGDIIRVDDLFVVERARRKGVGRLLMLEIAKIALEMNVITRWEIEPVNLPAQAFYRGLGAYIRDKVVAHWDNASMKAALAGPS